MKSSSRPKPSLRFSLPSPPPPAPPPRPRPPLPQPPHAPSPISNHHHLLHQNSLTQTENPKTTNYEQTILSFLKSCSTQKSILQGQQTHAHILKTRLEANTFIHNSLINMYAKCGFLASAKSLFDSNRDVEDPVPCNIMIAGYVNEGRLCDAREVFDRMSKKGCVSYTTMIMGYVKNGFWSNGVLIFEEMRKLGVIPSEVTLASVISGLCGSDGGGAGGGIQGCRMIHGLAIKMLLDGCMLVATNLIKFYCVCSYLGEARALFDEMPERNIVTWNVMLNGYVKGKLVDLAREVFERILDKDLISWSTIINGYIRVEMLSEAFKMYHSMSSKGLEANEVMMVDLVSACGKKMAFSEGWQLHCVVLKRGFDSHDFMQATIIHFYGACGRINEAHLQFELGIQGYTGSCNALISGYLRKKMLDQARQIFNEMPERDVFSWSTMISGYSQNEQPDVALELFHKMADSGIKPSEVTMVSVLSAIATLGTLREGKLAHEYILNNSIPLSDNLIAAIIDMYAKCSNSDTALEFFNQVQDKISTVSPWNAIICGLAMHGNADLSLKIYSDLRMRNVKPNAITFIGVLSACCHAGLVEVGEGYFRSMKSVHNVEPDIKHYGCMVDLLGRAGRLEDAEELIRKMPMNADVVIWGTLLAACRTHGNVEVGARAAENLAKLEPSHSGGRVLLSNLYADAQKWDDSLVVRREMKSNQMQRLPGLSGVT